MTDESVELTEEQLAAQAEETARNLRGRGYDAAVIENVVFTTCRGDSGFGPSVYITHVPVHGALRYDSNCERRDCRESAVTITRVTSLHIDDLPITCQACGSDVDDCCCTDHHDGFGEGCGECNYLQCQCNEAAPRIKGDFSYIRGNRTPAYPRSVGIELELIGASDWAPLSAFAARHGASIRHDGSISSGDAGGELVSPPAIGDAVESMITDMASALASAYAKTDDSCGLHIHVSVGQNPEHTIPRLLALWHMVEGVVFERYAPDRTDNEYCQPIASSLHQVYKYVFSGELPETSLSSLTVGDYRPDDRYAALNVLAYNCHKTVEFRLFSPVKTSEGLLERIRVVSRLTSIAARKVDINVVKQYTANQLVSKLAENNDSWSSMLTA